MKRTGILIAAGALALTATACGGGEASTIGVTLQEFSVIPGQDSAPAGDITFEVENAGPEDPHEFVVIQTELAPDALPTAGDGSVDEEGEGIEVLGEIEEFPSGESRSQTFTLDAGTYVFICNVVEEHEGETEAHYQLGMRTAFTVE